MKLLNNRHKDSKIPTIVTNTSGELIYMNDKAFSALPSVKIGDKVSEIVDIDCVKKISMYDDKIEVVKTKIKPYEKAVMKVEGKGIYKSIEIFLENDENIDSPLGDKNSIFMFAEAINDNSNENIRILDFINTIADRISYKKGYSYKKLNAFNVTDEEFYTNRPKLEILLISSTFILNEINYIDPIDVYVKKANKSLSISLSVKTDEFGDHNIEHAEERVCALFPQVLTRASFVYSICEECGIERGISYKDGHLIINLKIKESPKKGEYSFRSGAKIPLPDSYERIDRYIEIFGFNSK